MDQGNHSWRGDSSDFRQRWRSCRPEEAAGSPTLCRGAQEVTLETMSDLFENPLGLDGFEFLEFCAPEKGVLERAFERMGLSLKIGRASCRAGGWACRGGRRR